MKKKMKEKKTSIFSSRLLMLRISPPRIHTVVPRPTRRSFVTLPANTGLTGCFSRRVGRAGTVLVSLVECQRGPKTRVAQPRIVTTSSRSCASSGFAVGRVAPPGSDLRLDLLLGFILGLSSWVFLAEADRIQFRRLRQSLFPDRFLGVWFQELYL